MSDEIHRIVPDGRTLSRIAQLDQRTALPDQYLHSAEADVRPQGGSPGLTRFGHEHSRTSAHNPAI